MSDLESNLRQFTGSDNYIKWSILFRRHYLTDGTNYLAKTAGCYWLMDIIASHHAKAMKYPRLQQMQIWILKVKGSEAKIQCWEDTGEGEKPKITQKIPFTDFPLDELKLYVMPQEINGVLSWVIMLPSEY